MSSIGTIIAQPLTYGLNHQFEEGDPTLEVISGSVAPIPDEDAAVNLDGVDRSVNHAKSVLSNVESIGLETFEAATPISAFIATFRDAKNNPAYVPVVGPILVGLLRWIGQLTMLTFFLVKDSFDVVAHGTQAVADSFRTSTSKDLGEPPLAKAPQRAPQPLDALAAPAFRRRFLECGSDGGVA